MKKIVLISFCLFVVISACQVVGGMVIPNPYHKSEYCPPERPFTDYGYPYMNQDDCLGCDATEPMYVMEHETDFEVCAERETVNGYSRLKKCPDNFFRDQNGRCVLCEELKFVTVEKELDCSVCSNREAVSVEQHGGTFLHCQLKICPPEAPLTAGGDCFSCDADVFPTNAKEACEKCPNRIFLKKGYTLFENDEKRIYIKDDVCITNEYDSDRPVLSLSRKTDVKYFPKENEKVIHIGGFFSSSCVDCSYETEYRLQYEPWHYSCDEKNDITTLPEMCARCPNREYKNGVCIFKNCPENSIEGSYYQRGDDFFEEECIDCQFYSPIYTSKKNCHQCPNKFFVEGKGELGTCFDCFEKDETVYNGLSLEEKSRCSQEKSEESDEIGILIEGRVDFVPAEKDLK